MILPSAPSTAIVYAPSGRTCLPPIYIFGVRSTCGKSRPSSRSVDGIIGRAEICSPHFFDSSNLKSGRGRSIHFGRRYSNKPSLPPSRPKPDSRYPPKPEAPSKRFVELTHTDPALILLATSSARLMLSLHTLAASP